MLVLLFSCRPCPSFTPARSRFAHLHGYAMKLPGLIDYCSLAADVLLTPAIFRH
jgi:hypothetical protein